MERKLLSEYVIEPGTGKALELLEGQVLRIEQMEYGGQCADFNCFNLHDYKEYFHAARTRHMHGMHPSKGDFLWSAPPRERPMAAIVEDTSGTNDVFYARCSAFQYEYRYGLSVHTNCNDIQAEAQREYGLTPDDVHDSFNLFMRTGIDPNGLPYIATNTARKGDYVEILSLFDLLTVPNVCGSDVTATSWFELKPLRLSIYQSLPGERDQFADRLEVQHFLNQRTPEQFKVKQIKADRELKRDQTYVPEFVNVPLRIEEVEVTLSTGDRKSLEGFKAAGGMGTTDSEVLRFVFHSWWIHNFMRGPRHVKPDATTRA